MDTQIMDRIESGSQAQNCYVKKSWQPIGRLSDFVTKSGKAKYNTVCVWEGPSPRDGQAVIVLVSGLGSTLAQLAEGKAGSTNRKTGAMLQVAILLRDVNPEDASSRRLDLGLDEGICGGCQLRPLIFAKIKAQGLAPEGSKPCYVKKTQHGLVGMWESFHRGNVPSVKPEIVSEFALLHGLSFREGTYGDPAFVPYEVWETLSTEASPIGTSYTHDWQNPASHKMARRAMASIDPIMAISQGTTSLELKRQANGLGFRTYRVITSDDVLDDDEIICPEEQTSGRIQCIDCGLCSGQRRNAKNIAITGIN